MTEEENPQNTIMWERTAHSQRSYSNAQEVTPDAQSCLKNKKGRAHTTSSSQHKPGEFYCTCLDT